MQEIILIIHMILAIILVAVVLLQRSEGGALGIGGGGGGGALFSSRGAANLLTRITAIVATLFILTSITLSILAGQESRAKNQREAVPAAEEPLQVPQVPISE